ncbi:MAG: protocatechuate 4,5-dioxygenase subunit alpha [Bradyrhizobium sp.]|nr:protocatechuate 4,5-dioxygenase subunit alpha [Bradyrhizobium sp.]
MSQALDYTLSRLFYDLHTDQALAAEYRADRGGVLSRYRLSQPVVDALWRDDVASLARLTNGFLLRYYFLVAGMTEHDFVAALRAMRQAQASEILDG